MSDLFDQNRNNRMHDPYGLAFLERQEALQRNAKRGLKAFGAWFVFCLLLGLGLTAVVVWAIVSLVLHYT